MKNQNQNQNENTNNNTETNHGDGQRGRAQTHKLRLPLMNSIEDAQQLSRLEQDGFYRDAFLIQVWVGTTHAKIQTEYAEKKTARNRSLQSGQAWQTLDKVLGDTLRKRTLVQRLCSLPIDKAVPLDDHCCWKFLRTVARFVSFDHPLAAMLRSAFSCFAIEKGFDLEAVMETPFTLPQHFGISETAQFCDWVDSILHQMNHQLWHFAPVMFDPDPKGREFASFGLITRHVRMFDDIGQTVWRRQADETAKALEEPANAKKFNEGFLRNKPRVWNYRDVDRAVITLWPLVKRHNWTYADLLKVIRPTLKRPTAYPCETEQRFADHCNLLGLRKTGKGRSAKGEPVGADVARRLLGIKG